MSEPYFSRRPTSRHKERTIRWAFRGHEFILTADAGVFSKDSVDRGTEVLANALELSHDAHVLDLGCGYGVLGIVASAMAPNGRVVLTDVNGRAVELARRNVVTNGLAHAEVRLGAFYEAVPGERFHAIVSNPPLRAGKAVVYRMVDEARDYLRPGGALWMVARTRQGAPSLKERMAAALGNCEVAARRSGYRVLRSVSRESENP